MVAATVANPVLGQLNVGGETAPSVADVACEVLFENPSFEKRPEGFKAVLREYVDLLAVGLRDDFNRPVNLETLIEVKWKALNLCEGRGFPERIATESVTESPFGDAELFALSTAREPVQRTLRALRKSLSEWQANPQKLLLAHGDMEEGEFIRLQLGGCAEACRLYSQGKLTIGDLFALRPDMLIKDDLIA